MMTANPSTDFEPMELIELISLCIHIYEPLMALGLFINQLIEILFSRRRLDPENSLLLQRNYE